MTTPSPLTTTPPPHIDTEPKPIAHWAHTLALVFILTLTTVFGRARASSATATPSHLLSYATTMLLEWLLLGAVIAGIYRRRDFFMTSFRNGASVNQHSAATTTGLGFITYILGFMAIAIVSLTLMATPLGHQRNVDYVLAMLPRKPLEFVLWFCVSLTAGICEELIFRGYLLRQLVAWTHNPILSIFIGALLFGSVHLYEGLGAILPLAALAVVYGFVVRHFKGDLRAVIIAHTLQDFLVGFLGLAKPFLDRYQATHGIHS